MENRQTADSETWSLPRSPRLMAQVRERIRALHYSRRTEQAYVQWCKAFIRFHGLRHPSTMGGPEVEAFLTHLALERRMAASSHRQALAALLFLYGKVLGQQLPWMNDIGRPAVTPRLPVVLSVDEVQRIFARLEGVHRLFAQLLHGTGLRIHEGLRLRVKDIDFANQAVFVRNGKGGKDRIVLLPNTIRGRLRDQLETARTVWDADMKTGNGGVQMPSAMDCKYPRAGDSWAWFWVFPQAKLSTDPVSGVVRRHHMYPATFQRAFK